MLYNNKRHKAGCVCAKSLNHVRLFASPWTVARQASLSMGFPRQEYWSGLPCPSLGDVPDPGIKTVPLSSPALAGGFLTTSANWESRHEQLSRSWCKPKTRRQEKAFSLTAMKREVCLRENIQISDSFWLMGFLETFKHKTALGKNTKLCGKQGPKFRLSHHYVLKLLNTMDLWVYQVSGTVLSSLYILTHLILRTTLWPLRWWRRRHSKAWSPPKPPRPVRHRSAM